MIKVKLLLPNGEVHPLHLNKTFSEQELINNIVNLFNLGGNIEDYSLKFITGNPNNPSNSCEDEILIEISKWSENSLRPHRVMYQVPSITDDLNDMEKWWEIVKKHKYPIYSIFLLNSLNEEMTNLIAQHYNDLDKMTSSSCALLVFFNKKFKKKEIKKHTDQAYKVAEYFDVPRTEFPCIVFLDQSLNSALWISFKDLSTKEIFKELEGIVDKIDKATSNGKAAISAIRRHNRSRKIKIVAKKGLEGISKTIAEVYIDKMLEKI